VESLPAGAMKDASIASICRNYRRLGEREAALEWAARISGQAVREKEIATLEKQE
jgi:hypothetical protein